MAQWGDGSGPPVFLLLRRQGWQAPAPGAPPHAALEVVLDDARRLPVLAAEWVRPAGDRLLVGWRRVGGALAALEPPQPLLVAPLEPGRTWSWAGRIDGVEATLEARVAALEAHPRWGPRTLVVERRVRLDGLESTVQQRWCEDVGLVEERGDFPVQELGLPVDRLRARQLARDEQLGLTGGAAPTD